MRRNLVWDICAFVPSEAGLTKEVVFHEDGLSKEVLLYITTQYYRISILYLRYYELCQFFAVPNY